jgi:hypothetical protein
MTIPLIHDDDELESYGVLRVKLPASLDCIKWAAELSTLTPQIIAGEGDGEYAFYRNILDEPDFPFSMILTSSEIGDRIVRHFKIQSLSEIRLDDAFCVYYNNLTQDDTSGAKHVDPSDITVNMCLEKTELVQDSHVVFYGTQALEGIEHKKHDSSFQFLVEQIPGYATIHWGHHPHETLGMTGEGGTRTNIVLTYCYCDSSRSDVVKRTCYSLG